MGSAVNAPVHEETLIVEDAVAVGGRPGRDLWEIGLSGSLGAREAAAPAAIHLSSPARTITIRHVSEREVDGEECGGRNSGNLVLADKGNHRIRQAPTRAPGNSAPHVREIFVQTGRSRW